MSSQVVVAVIVREDRLLLTQRVPTKSFPYQWEFPGGKVEKGESLAQALWREVDEELGVLAVEPVKLAELLVERSALPPSPMTYFGVRCAAPDRIRMKAAVGMGWFTFEQARRLDMSPGTSAFVDEMFHETTLYNLVFGL